MKTPSLSSAAPQVCLIALTAVMNPRTTNTLVIPTANTIKLPKEDTRTSKSRKRLNFARLINSVLSAPMVINAPLHMVWTNFVTNSWSQQITRLLSASNSLKKASATLVQDANSCTELQQKIPRLFPLWSTARCSRLWWIQLKERAMKGMIIMKMRK